MPNQLPTDLDFKADKAASPERMNRAMSNINDRVSALETYKPQFDELLATIQQTGLNKLNDILLPIFVELTSLLQLGEIMSAQSASSVTIGMGAKTFVVDDDAQAAVFAPAKWLSIMTADAAVGMSGRLTSYDRTTGTLVLNIMETYGSGTFNAWLISPSSPPMLAAPVVDAGTFDGIPQQVGLIPYLYSGPTQPLATPSDGGTF